jgi:hypothetical protein
VFVKRNILISIVIAVVAILITYVLASTHVTPQLVQSILLIESFGIALLTIYAVKNEPLLNRIIPMYTYLVFYILIFALFFFLIGNKSTPSFSLNLLVIEFSMFLYLIIIYTGLTFVGIISDFFSLGTFSIVIVSLLVLFLGVLNSLKTVQEVIVPNLIVGNSILIAIIVFLLTTRDVIGDDEQQKKLFDTIIMFLASLLTLLLFLFLYISPQPLYASPQQLNSSLSLTIKQVSNTSIIQCNSTNNLTLKICNFVLNANGAGISGNQKSTAIENSIKSSSTSIYFFIIIIPTLCLILGITYFFVGFKKLTSFINSQRSKIQKKLDDAKVKE